MKERHENIRSLAEAADTAVAPESEIAPPETPVPDAPVSPEAPGAATSSAEIEALRQEAARAAEHWNNLLRTAADFDNFRKRVARERQDLLKYAAEGVMQKLIPVLDNFEAALIAAANASGDAAKSLQTGVAMIHQQFRSALVDSGLKEIDATGQRFDPNVHEAVAQEPSESVAEGRVVRQLRKGYQLHDRLLRPATVIVAKKPDGAA